MATTIGMIELKATIDTSQYRAGADEIESTNRRLENSAESVSKGNSRMSSAISKVGKVARVAAVAGVATLTATSIAAAKASWNQVDAVQQAAAMLGRYYKSADDVTTVQQELIKYAQSDMGVLFNRKDLFQAAGNLAMYGSSAKDVTKQVEILSRGMASNVLSWDEMNAVVGRVVSSGKLSRTEFEMLSKAGYNLDASLANTTVTTEEFFKILDNSIPKDISQDMNNIVPVGIRLQTAFRGIGNAILGVNELQDGFLPGSLGERIINTMQNLTTLANDIAPKVRSAVQTMIDVFDGVMESVRAFGASASDYLMPKVMALWGSIKDNLIPSLQRLWRDVIEPMLPVIGTLLVGAIGAVIDIMKIAIDVTGWLIDRFSDLWGMITNGNPIIWGLIGLLGTLSAALAISQGVAAFSAAMTAIQLVHIPKAVGAFAAMKTLMLSPIVLPALAIGAALASIAAVVQAWQGAKAAIEQQQSAVQAEFESSVEIMQGARARYDRGEISMEQLRHIVGVAARAKGGPVSGGKAYLVGENRDGSINDTTELFVPNSSGRIINSKDLQSALGGSGSHIEYNISNVNISSEVDGEKWLRRLTGNQEITSAGLVPRQSYM